MAKIDELSDQFHKGSAKYGKSTDKSAPTPGFVNTTASVDEAGVSTGLADRALQAMWQARVQMCPGAGPWSQVLSFRKPIGASAGNDLCAAARRQTGRRLSCESDGCSRTFGGDLRDQSGAVKKAGGFLRICHGAGGVNNPLGVCRLFGGGNSGRQYAPGLSLRAIGCKGDRR